MNRANLIFLVFNVVYFDNKHFMLYRTNFHYLMKTQKETFIEPAELSFAKSKDRKSK